jgi:transcriptional regulator with XRE-family HTH domain
VEQGAVAVGERISRARKLRKLTLEELAREAHVSLSLLNKVIAGTRTATPALLGKLAPVLDVSIPDLSGLYSNPYTAASAAVGVLDVAINALHAALLRYDLPPEPTGPVRPLAQLRAATAEVSDLRTRGSYGRLGRCLPELIDELTWVAHTAPEQQRPEAFRLLTTAYFAVHAMAYKHGFAVLASLAEERISWSAGGTEDPLLRALADWTRCHSYLATGGPNLAVGLRRLELTRRALDGQLGRFGGEEASVYGAVLLREAVLAARSNDPALAWSRIGHAREMVARGASDANQRSVLTSGPVNSKIVEVAVAVELGDAEAAIALARELVIPSGFPPVRASHHFIDLGRALTWNGQRRKALTSLLTAEKYARQQTLWHPETGATVSRLMSLEKHPPDELLGLVARMRQAGAPSPLR